MKKTHRAHFAQKLILYLLSMFGMIFFAVFLSIFLNSQAYFRKNAALQAEQIAANLSRIFERKLNTVEQIPRIVFKNIRQPGQDELSFLPTRILNTFPMVQECHISFDTVVFSASKPKFPAFDLPVEIRSLRSSVSSSFVPDRSRFFRKSPGKGYWTLERRATDTLYACYCEPFYIQTSFKQHLLYLKIDIHYLTDFFKDVTFFKTGFPFIVDDKGSLLVSPPGANNDIVYLKDYLDWMDIPPSPVFHHFVQGEKGHKKITGNRNSYYFYYTPLFPTKFRLGIICPYREILFSSQGFVIFLLLVFLVGLLFICWMVICIVRRQAAPLKTFTSSIKKITDGELNDELPVISSNDEIKELYDAFKSLQDHLLRYNEELKKTTQEKEKIVTEIKQARNIQNKFLPKETDLPANIEIWGELKQCKTIGGDFYDYFSIGPLFYFILGDVSGKGIPAALYTVSIIKLFRYVARRYTSTAEICRIMNNFTYDDSEDDMYITLFTGILDVNTGILHFTNAGHPDPVVIQENLKVDFLHRYPDVPLGILKDYHYPQYTCTLQKNSQLLFFTDGITDAENDKGQFYGKERLMECIRHAAGKKPKELTETILQKILEHTGKAVQSDDFTILSLLYKGNLENPENSQFTSSSNTCK